MSEQAPVAKRPRRSSAALEKDEKTDDRSESKRELLTTLWQHWQAYLASTEDPENPPDTDELIEMLEIGREHRDMIPVVTPPADFFSGNKQEDEKSLVDFYVQSWKNPWDLIPVLLSVAALVLADDAIALYLEQKSGGDIRPHSDQARALQDGTNDEPLAALSSTCRDDLQQALTWFPVNASTWSMLANWVRMTQVREQQALEIARLYRYAAHQANILRRASLHVLSQCNDEQEQEDDEAIPTLPTIVEALVLNQVVGVEFEGPEEAEEEEEEEGKEDPTEGTKSNDNEQWSVSAVEGTSRFMAAMQLSMAGYHDEAVAELGHYNLSHRLHPNVWDKSKATVGRKEVFSSIMQEPALFNGPVLPKDVLEKLLQIFAPNAPYWVESGYSHRGYYSFFIDRLAKDQMPKDQIQDVIETFLLPLVENKLPSDAAPIVGYEWWVHTRPLAANLGHNLHFDTDEALLKQEQEVTHPLVSSVLYLDGTGDPGPTIVLNQSSEVSAPNADMIWRNDPSPNTYLIFPGNLLHGVLPCGASVPATVNRSEKCAGLDVTVAPDLKNYLSEDVNSSRIGEELHRLSFMVGFWTRRVPDKMKDPTCLYGPCSPMPPNTHSWVKQAQEGYPRNGFGTATNAPEPRAVPHVSPAWQLLPDKGPAVEEQPLEIPKALDHRYFVLDPPRCFRESLFERNDGESDYEESEVEEDDGTDD